MAGFSAWWKRLGRPGQITVSILAVVVGLGLLGALASIGGGSDKKAASSPPPAAAAPGAQGHDLNLTGSRTAEDSPPPPPPPPPTPPPPPPKPEETAGQQNARRSAEDYLESQGFSRKGLIKQLSSQYGEGYTKAEAIYAVNHINVDWNEQAVRAAKSYLKSQAFSRQNLIEQLSSDYGDGFTHAQAVYGVNKAYR